MKDLIQEGRKIQETFKKNVVNEDGIFSKIASKLRSMRDPDNYSKLGKWGMIDYNESPHDSTQIFDYVGLGSYISDINRMPFVKKYNKKIKFIVSRAYMPPIGNKIVIPDVDITFKDTPDSQTLPDVTLHRSGGMDIRNEKGVDDEYKKLLKQLGNQLISDLEKELKSLNWRDDHDKFQRMAGPDIEANWHKNW